MTQEDFAPDWVSKPSDTLTGLMARRGLSAADLIEALDGDRGRARALLAGLIPIDEETAVTLGELVGVQPSFWIRRQRAYATGLARAVGSIPSTTIDAWVRQLPLKDMRAFGWLDKADSTKVAELCLAFFGVAGLDEWQRRYTNHAGLAFRTSPTFESHDGALAAWLRQGELEAQAAVTADWNASLARQLLVDIRRLSWAKRPSLFVPKLKALLARAGVVLVFARTPSGCRASGAARFLSDKRALIQLSFRYKTDDQVWFTLFHELGHLLIHGRSAAFVDDGEPASDQFEQEADEFASSAILSHQHRERLYDLPPRAKPIIKFAADNEVAPGLLVGQMQHAGIIGRNQLNMLKRRYEWDEVAKAFA